MPLHTHHANYRPDIDGLRAFAVLSVLLYHINTASLSGGFVGVDVFFVISGYLITRIIRDDLINGTFSFFRFYERRARRILPALFTVMLLSLGMGVLMLTPTDLVAFSNSLGASLFFVSNIHFWQEIGYFTADVEVKPLLHTWSLSVEEQFYLFWPILLIALHRFLPRRAMLPVIIVLALASLAAAEYTLPRNANAVFYLLPFRVFELAIGAMLTFATIPSPSNYKPWHDGIFLAGIALILIAITQLTIKTPFPSLYALLPCVGAAAIIYAGAAARARVILSNPLMVYLGLISYSLYLVHWPLIVYFKYLGLAEVTPTNAALIASGAVVLASLIYYSIETPLRHPKKSPHALRYFIVGCVVVSVALAATALTIRTQKGWLWRLDSGLQMAQNDPTKYLVSQFGIGDFFYHDLNHLGDSAQPPSFVMVGDSFAGQYVHGVHTMLKQNGRAAMSFAIPACMFRPGYTMIDQGKEVLGCLNSHQKMMGLLQNNTLPLVIAYNWCSYFHSIVGPDGNKVTFATPDEYDQWLLQMLDGYRTDIGPDRQLTLIGLGADIIAKNSLSRCMNLPKYLPNGCGKKAIFLRKSYTIAAHFNSLLERYAATHPNTHFINPLDAFCNATECIAMQDKTLYFVDVIHLSRDGSIHFANYFSDLFLSLHGAPIPTPAVTPPPAP